MARRSPCAAVRPAGSQDSLPDTEGEDSRRLSAVASLLQKPKTNDKELQDFKMRVIAGQAETKALLEQRAQQTDQSSVRRRNELAEAFVDALQTPNQTVPGAPPTFGDTCIARNAIFKSVAEILTHSVSLINEYDRLDKIIADTLDTEPKNVSEAWTEDKEKIAKLLRIGAKTAIRNVKKVLGAEIGEDGIEDIGEESENMDMVEKMDLNYKLHEGLQYAERGVKNMVKSLPLDEGALGHSNGLQ